LGEGNITLAIRILNKGLLTDPNNPSLLQTLGTAYAQKQSWLKAAYYYALAIDNSPEADSDTHLLIGIAFFHLGKINQAIIELNDGLKTDPGNYQARWFLAQCYYNTGRFVEAINEYKIMLNTAQGVIVENTHYMIADIYRLQGQFDDAIIELKKGLEINPNMGEAHYWLGKCYEEKGLLTESKSEYQIAESLGYNEGGGNNGGISDSDIPIFNLGIAK
jgi:tetratricopeptide (TPR) repeat protein